MPRYPQHGRQRRDLLNDPRHVNFIMHQRLERQQRTVRAREGNPSTVAPYPVPDSLNSGPAAIRAQQRRENEREQEEAQLRRLEAAHAAHLQALGRDQANAIMHTPPRRDKHRRSLRPHKKRPDDAARSAKIFQALRNLFHAFQNPSLPLVERNLKSYCAMRWTQLGYLPFKCADLCLSLIHI